MIKGPLANLPGRTIWLRGSRFIPRSKHFPEVFGRCILAPCWLSHVCQATLWLGQLCARLPRARVYPGATLLLQVR